MLRIATIRERASAPALSETGGFCWYYADMCDDCGNGIVLNWALGLPFLAGSRLSDPGRSSATMNMVAYRAGRPLGYLLQEWPRSAVEFDTKTGNARFGTSSLELRDEGGHTTLEARLDLALPEGERWRGNIEITGSTFLSSEEQVSAASSLQHLWCPQTVHACGRAELSTSSERWAVSGSAYVDSNLSAIPLHEQGIARWDWGRVHFRDYTLVFYRARGESKRAATGDFCELILVHPDGQNERLVGEFEGKGSSTSLYFVSTARRLRWRTASGDFVVELVQPLDRSPFYERYFVRGLGPGGELGSGFAEAVLPGRLDRAWMRPFIRMRTHSLMRRNSFWLPLFSGSPGAAAARLWKSLGRAGDHV